MGNRVAEYCAVTILIFLGCAAKNSYAYNSQESASPRRQGGGAQQSQGQDRARQGANLEGLAIDSSLGLEYTNNVADSSSSEEKESEIERRAMLEVSYAKQARLLNSDFSYSVSRNDYAKDQFDDETLLQGTADFILASHPDRYGWRLSHQQDYEVRDSKEVDTPGNRELRGIITTGPFAVLRLSPVDNLKGTISYTQSVFRDTDENDSKRTTGDLSWTHRISRLTSMGISGSVSDIKYEEETRDSKDQRVGININGLLKRGRYAIGYGVTKIKQDVGDDVDGYFANVNLVYVGELDTFGLSLNKDVTDSSVGLSLTDFETEVFTSGDSNFSRSDIVTRSRAQLTYSRNSRQQKIRTIFSLSADDSDYEDLLEDEKVYGAGIKIEYRYSQQIGFGLQLAYDETDFVDQKGLGKNKSYSASIFYDHALNDRLRLNFNVSSEKEKNEFLADREFETIDVVFTLNYRIR